MENSLQIPHAIVSVFAYIQGMILPYTASAACIALAQFAFRAGPPFLAGSEAPYVAPALFISLVLVLVGFLIDCIVALVRVVKNRLAARRIQGHGPPR